MLCYVHLMIYVLLYALSCVADIVLSSIRAVGLMQIKTIIIITLTYLVGPTICENERTPINILHTRPLIILRSGKLLPL